MHTNTHTCTDWQANKVVDRVQIMTASSVFVLILMWVCVTVCVCDGWGPTGKNLPCHITQ